MPTLVRLLTALAVIAAVIFAVMATLIRLVEPTQRPITVEVPLEQLRPDPAPIRRTPDIPE